MEQWRILVVWMVIGLHGFSALDCRIDGDWDYGRAAR